MHHVMERAMPGARHETALKPASTPRFLRR